MYAKLVSENPIGAGLGGSGRAATLSENNVLPGVEHGLQDVVFSLGWFGGAVYFAGGLLLLLQALRARDDSRDRFPTIARAISAGVVSMLLFGNVFISLGGFVLWGFLGAQVAARRYAMSGPETA
jgi:cell division protein FtsW (lipid II flippase)